MSVQQTEDFIVESSLTSKLIGLKLFLYRLGIYFAALSAIYVLMGASISAIKVELPAVALQGFSLLAPSNLQACFALILSAESIYRINFFWLKLSRSSPVTPATLPTTSVTMGD